MILQLDKNQQYQLDATSAVIDLLERQDLNTSDFEFSHSDHASGSLQCTEAGVGNLLTAAPEQILSNLHKIQYRNEVTYSERLEYPNYKLDLVKAYDLGLVKQIEVDSVLSQFDSGGAYVSLDAFKLPSWFIIIMPIGNYNPNWALIKRGDGDESKIYFVAETKDAIAVHDLTLLRDSEREKIKCVEKHFAGFSDVRFQVVGSVGELKNL